MEFRDKTARREANSVCKLVQTEIKRKSESKRIRSVCLGFPGGAVVENLPANAGDTGSSPGLGRSHMPRSN